MLRNSKTINRLEIGRDGMLPYESSWMLLLKILSFNIMSLSQFYQVLEHSDSRNLRPYWSSENIDLIELSAAISVPAEQLRFSFYDQIVDLALPSKVHAIRHCSECIKHRYHSVLFEFAVLTHCPIHGRPLELCRVCSSVLPHRGKPKKLEGANSYCLKLSCGHFEFDSSHTPCLPPRDVPGFLDGVQLLTDCINWLQRCRGTFLAELAEPYISTIDGSAQQEQDWRRKLMRCRYAEQVLGSFPSATQTLVSNAPRQSLILSGGPAVTVGAWRNRAEEDVAELKSLQKSIRRYIFKQYVRPHRRCWKLMAGLPQGRLNALELEAMCSVCCAYRAWRYALQWRPSGSKGEVKGYNLVGMSGMEVPKDANSIARFWLIHFLTIWYGLEQAYNQCMSSDDRYGASVAMQINTSQPPLRIGENALVEFTHVPFNKASVSIAYFDPAVTEALSSGRCSSRAPNTSFMDRERDPGSEDVMSSGKAVIKLWKKGKLFSASNCVKKCVVSIG